MAGRSSETNTSAQRRLACTALLIASAACPGAWAVPSYARQTGQDCGACHVGAFGPQLTPFGVQFKIGGYIDSDGKAGKLPLSGMVMASRTSTSKARDTPPADGYKTNNSALDKATLFVAGRLADHLRAFAQVSDDGIGKSTALGQLDQRVAHATD